MNIASIDIGSNTLLLLIAEYDKKTGRINHIYSDYKMPRLSKNLLTNNQISEEKIIELLQILSEYKIKANEYNVDEILVNATNAFRIASNSTKIQNLIFKELGLHVNIIPGEKEAELSYWGALSSHSDNNNNFLVIDIGGTSTEIVLGNKNSITFKKSLQLGAVTITEKCVTKFPIIEKEINDLRIEIEKIIQSLSFLSIPTNIKGIAVAGTPTSVACMKAGIKKYNESVVEGALIELIDLEKLNSEIKVLNTKMILEKYGEVVIGREDVIFAGIIILEELMKFLGLSCINVSERDLRYGAIFDHFKRKDRGE